MKVGERGCHRSLLWDFRSSKRVEFYFYLCLPCITCVPDTHRGQKRTLGVGSTGTRVIGSCECPCVCWKLNLNSLEEGPVLLTTEPSLLSPSSCILLMRKILCMFSWYFLNSQHYALNSSCFENLISFFFFKDLSVSSVHIPSYPTWYMLCRPGWPLLTSASASTHTCMGKCTHPCVYTHIYAVK